MPSTHLSLHYHLIFNSQEIEAGKKYICNQEQHFRLKSFSGGVPELAEG